MPSRLRKFMMMTDNLYTLNGRSNNLSPMVLLVESVGCVSSHNPLYQSSSSQTDAPDQVIINQG